jgi:CHRD domain
MNAKWMLAAAAIGCVAVAAAPAGAATKTQFRAKCSNAWTGSKETAAFRTFRTKCTTAATAATSDATDAGNPTNATANSKRSKAACNVQFPLPRKSAAKKKAFNTCVTASNSAQKAFAPKPLKATLRGANEVPAAGGATGTASVRINLAQKRVCVTLTIKNFGAAGAILAHIHKGAAGANGPPVVDLTTTDLLSALDHNAPAKLCVNGVATALMRDIRAHPGSYYVNIHNTQYPGGAARGQLHK